MATPRKPDVRHDRYVVTYEPTQWPEVVITGYCRWQSDSERVLGGDKGFFMEHLIVLPGAPEGALFGALGELIKLAWEWGFHFIEFWIPNGHPHARALDVLARRKRFTMYHEVNDTKFYVLWRV